MENDRNIPRIYQCEKLKEPVCRRKSVYDPRSFCHSILSKPGKVCKKSTCRKFLKTSEERNDDEIVCIPRTCKMIRRSGPIEDEDEKFYRMYGHELGIVIPPTLEEIALDKQILTASLEKQIITAVEKQIISRSRERMISALKKQIESSEFLDEDEADICPCCKCAVCICKLSEVSLEETQMEVSSDETLVEDKKPAFIEKKVHTPLLQAQQRQEYAWSFDYFENPDFEYFENTLKEQEKQRKKSKKDQELKDTGGIVQEESAKSPGVPSMESAVEKDVTKIISSILDETLEQDSASQLGYTPAFLKRQKKEELFDIKECIDGRDFKAEYGLSQRSSIERWVQTREPITGRRPTTLSGASEQPLDPTFPAVEIKGKIRIISKEEPAIPIIEPIIEERKDTAKKRKESFIEIYDPVLKRKPPVPSAIFPTEAEEQQESKIPPSQKNIYIPPPEKKEKISKKWLEELIHEEIFEEEARKQHSSVELSDDDVCKCLPGFCVCGSKHYVFKETSMSSKTKLDTDNVAQVDTKSDQHIGDTLSNQSSCVCYHPWREKDDLLRVTPVGSIQEEPRRKTVVCTQPEYQKTVIIVKPEAMNYKDVILRAIANEGLHIIDQRLLRLSPEQVIEIYGENYGSAYFPLFVEKMSSTPILVLLVAGIYAVDRWKYITGDGEIIPSSWFYPDSIKRRFGIHCDIYGSMKTSSDFPAARREIGYFFPLDIMEPIMIKSIEVQDYCDEHIHPTLLKGLYKVAKERPEDPLRFLAEFLLQNNPFQPHYPDIMLAMAPI